VARLDTADLERVLKLFRGDIRQAPPVFSALKHCGTPLYRLARGGKPIQKPPRAVTIHSLTVLGIALPEVRLRVRCSAGTYVRALCADIGAALGCGGHMAALRRTECCGFGLERAISLESLARRGEEAGAPPIIPMVDALPGMPEHRADAALAERIGRGAIVRREEVWTGHAGPEDRMVKVVDERRRLLAVVDLGGDTDRCRYRCVFHPTDDP
jgi:tRNA pseudouridine55 synthase